MRGRGSGQFEGGKKALPMKSGGSRECPGFFPGMLLALFRFCYVFDWILGMLFVFV